MNCTIKLFAGIRDAAGQEEVVVALGDTPTVADARSALIEQHPELGGLLAHSYFAIDGQYGNDTTKIPAGAEIACIPPVSGG